MGIIDIIKEELQNLFEIRRTYPTVFHGTSIEGAKDIQQNGINISKSEGGYFGVGFYTTPDLSLAKSNYADFAEGSGGAILEFQVDPQANILDTDDPQDFETWKLFAKNQWKPDFYKELVQAGIDGLTDNSFEGTVFYNPRVLKLIKIHQI
jgi:hypothetical protein